MTKYEELPRDDKGDIEPLKVEFPVEFPLATPVDVDGATIASLSIREPTVGDVEIADKEKAGLARMLRLLCALAEISPGAARALGTRDYTRLQELVGSFL